MSIGITAYAQPTADSLNRQKQQLENQKNQNIVLIINFDNKLIKDLSDKKEKINADETALKKNRDELLVYKHDNESKLADLQNNSKQQQQLIADAKSRRAYYMSQISDYKNKIEDENKQVQEAIKQLQAMALAQERTQGKGSYGSSGNIQAAPNAIIAYAYNFLGDPYVWGAAGKHLHSQI